MTLTLSESPHWVEKNFSLEQSTEFSPLRHLIGIDNDANVVFEIVFNIYNDIYIDKKTKLIEELLIPVSWPKRYSFLLLIVKFSFHLNICII